MPENQSDINFKNKPNVLITGGSGMTGRYLTSFLLSKGYNVAHLSRTTGNLTGVKVFHWDPDRILIDPEIFSGVDFIIHLAGANIGEKRWTKRRKEEIENSRVEFAKLLYKIVSENKIKLTAFISASAVGYYGSDTSEKVFSEVDPHSNDFLGKVCKEWEDAAGLFEKLGIRTVKIRTSMVLALNNGALSKLISPAKFGFLVQLGNGQQYVPWIHILDLCGIYLKAITDPLIHGTYNAVAPQHITHYEFIRILARVMKRPVFSIPVPGFIIRTVFGEMSHIILNGSRVSSEKIEKTGYFFRFGNLETALKNLIQK